MPGNCRNEQVYVHVRQTDENGDRSDVLRIVDLSTSRITVTRDGVTRQIATLPQLRAVLRAAARDVPDGAAAATLARRDGTGHDRVELAALGGTRAERHQRRSEHRYGQVTAISSADRPGTGQVLAGAARGTLRTLNEDRENLRDILSDPKRARESLNRFAQMYAPVLAREVRESTGTKLTSASGTKTGSYTTAGDRVYASFLRPSTGYAVLDADGRSHLFTQHPASRVGALAGHVTQSRAAKLVATVVAVTAGVYALRSGVPIQGATDTALDMAQDHLPSVTLVGGVLAASSQVISVFASDRYVAATDGVAPAEMHRPVVPVELADDLPARAAAADTNLQRANVEIDRSCTRLMKELSAQAVPHAQQEAADRAVQQGWDTATADRYAAERTRDAQSEIEASLGERGVVRHMLRDAAEQATEQLVSGQGSADDHQLLYAGGPARWVEDRMESAFAPELLATPTR